MAGRHARRPEGPVFVDPSGRRSRSVRRAGWAVSAVLLGYLALVLVALVGPPSLSRVAVPGLGPVLPGPAAAGLSGKGPAQPLREALARTPAPSPSVTRTPGPTPTPAVRATPTAGPTPTPSAAAPGRTSSPSPVGTATTRGSGRTTDKPVPPGASVRPSRPPR